MWIEPLQMKEYERLSIASPAAVAAVAASQAAAQAFADSATIAERKQADLAGQQAVASGAPAKGDAFRVVFSNATFHVSDTYPAHFMVSRELSVLRGISRSLWFSDSRCGGRGPSEEDLRVPQQAARAGRGVAAPKDAGLAVALRPAPARVCCVCLLAAFFFLPLADFLGCLLCSVKGKRSVEDEKLFALLREVRFLVRPHHSLAENHVFMCAQCNPRNRDTLYIVDARPYKV